MEEILVDIINCMEKRILFADDKGIIRYLNNAAKVHYLKKGLNNLIGRSLFEFHKDETNKKILSILEQFKNDSNLNKEVINTTTIYAVRDSNGKFKGIYEMY